MLEASTQRAQQPEEFGSGEPDEPNHIRLTIGTPDSPRPGRTAAVNGAPPKRASSLAGSFPAVVFDPGHLSLVKGAPEGRRKFLDAALCQLYPGYLALYRRYVRALQQKNALLRHSATGRERPYAEKAALLEVLNVELAQQGEAIQQRRRAYLERLAPLACSNYEELSHGAERLTLRYAAQFEPEGWPGCCGSVSPRSCGPDKAFAAPTGKTWSCCWTASRPKRSPARDSSAAWCSAWKTAAGGSGGFHHRRAPRAAAGSMCSASWTMAASSIC